MKAKSYTPDKIAEVVKALEQVDPLPPRYVPHEETLAQLAKHIRDLYFKKNYNERQINQILKQNGIKTTLKEVKNVIEKTKQKTTKNAAQK